MAMAGGEISGLEKEGKNQRIITKLISLQNSLDELFAWKIYHVAIIFVCPWLKRMKDFNIFPGIWLNSSILRQSKCRRLWLSNFTGSIRPPWKLKRLDEARRTSKFSKKTSSFWGVQPLFPNSFSYGVFANIGSGAASGGRFREVPGRFRGGFREGSGAGSERQVPGRFRSRFRITGSGKVPGQVPNHGFREGSGAGSERQVPGRFRVSFSNDGFQEGFGAGSESRVPGRFRGRFRTTGSGKVPEQVPNHGFREGSGAGSEPRVPGRFRGRFRTTFRTTGSRKVPGQVPNHGFREGPGAASERQVPGRFRVSFSNHGFQEGSGAGSEPRVPRRFWGRCRTTGSGKVPGQFFEPRSEPRVPGRFRGRFRFTSSWKMTVYVWIFNIYIYIYFSPTALAMESLPI